MDEEDSIKNEDYRLQAIITISKDWTSPWSKNTFKKGTPVMTIVSTKFDSDKILTFGLPNSTAMFIDISYVLWVESEAASKQENFVKSKSKYDKPNTFYPVSNEYLFDLLQKRMGSIVFAYTALESFANENIPDDYIYIRDRDDAKCTEKYSKDQIEKFLSLDIKLGNILPPIMNVNSPKGKDLWNKFKLIKDLRDRIIHLKTKDRKSATSEERTIWNDLISKEYPNFAITAKDIINYYLTKIPIKNKPRWFRKFPYR